MMRKSSILIASLFVLIGCASCHKEEIDSSLVGTSWEWVEEPGILVFSKSDSGIYYVKSATDGIYDDIYSSFDFTYEISGKNVTLHIFFSRFDSTYPFIIEDEETLTCGVHHFKKIQHKKH